MTRAKHMQFCKARAREYLDRGDANQAVTSMISDLSKHPETEGMAKSMGMLGLGLLMLPNKLEEARRFVEGFAE